MKRILANKKKKEMDVVFSVRMEIDVKNQIRKFSAETGCSQASIVRSILGTVLPYTRVEKGRLEFVYM